MDSLNKLALPFLLYHSCMNHHFQIHGNGGGDNGSDHDHDNVVYERRENLPQMCNRTTKAINRRLRTSTVVGPILSPGASSV